ncbi:MAG: glycosyltransferase [Candidatus Aureabacteria bacterium]|nr:glycosyltransferase [Candidatus Auribacterota bacterium]
MKISSPLLSAIVSAYNSERFIKGCLSDLINQTLYKKGLLEIIVINSGSEQNEDILIKEFQKKHPNLCYIKTRREPIYKAWNRGIHAAKGKYITNANTDDRHKNDALEIMVYYLEKHPDIDLVYAWQWISNIPNESFTDFIRLNPMKWKEEHRNKMLQVLKEPVIHSLIKGQEKGFYFHWPRYSLPSLQENSRIGPQPVWRKMIHEKLGYFDPKMEIAGDWEFWLRMAKAGCRFGRIPKRLGVFYLGETNKEFENHTGLWKEFLKIYDRYIAPQRKEFLFHVLYHLIKLPPINRKFYQRMKKVFETLPQDHESRLMMAEIHLHMKNRLKAAILIKKMGKAGKIVSPLFLYRTASCYQKMGNSSCALRWFEKVLHHSSSSNLKAGACYHLGEILMHSDRRLAMKYFTKCLNLSPDHQKAKRNLEAISITTQHAD